MCSLLSPRSSAGKDEVRRQLHRKRNYHTAKPAAPGLRVIDLVLGRRDGRLLTPASLIVLLSGAAPRSGDNAKWARSLYGDRVIIAEVERIALLATGGSWRCYL